MTETSLGVESLADGVYSIITTTRYNAAGQPVQKQLISELSPTLESKSVFVSERGLTSTQWSEYSEDTKRIQYSAVPTSDITDEAVTVDGFVLSQKDTAGVVSTATCPLAIQKEGTWYTYGWDLTKNLCEVYGQHGYLRTAYTYTPYGQVTAEGDMVQNIQWSSEFNDTELGLVYYNYRHYNPVDGRWTERDGIEVPNLYAIAKNNLIIYIDFLGNNASVVADRNLGKPHHLAQGFNFQGLIDSFVRQAQEGKDEKKCPCLKEISIVIHGNPSESVFGIDEGIARNDSLFPSQATQINDNNAYALFTELRIQLENRAGGFCKGCVIWYISCNTGLSSFVQKIANATRCTVYAPKGYARGNDYTKRKTRISKSGNSLPDVSASSRNGQKAADGLFRQYNPYREGTDVPREKYLWEKIMDSVDFFI